MVQVTAIILAAGKGTRMKSQIPKVLHKVCGQPMVQHVLDAVGQAGVQEPIVVIGHGSDKVQETLGEKLKYVVQAEQLGTGHAVMQTKDLLCGRAGHVLVLCGDTPLITPKTVSQIINSHVEKQATASVLTTLLADPTGYGRIVRNSNGTVEKIVEHKDATEAERVIKEINTGVYCFEMTALFAALDKITPANAQGEYYLTDVLEIIKIQGLLVQAVVLDDPDELMGINDRVQMAVAEGLMRQRISSKLMLSGVTIVDPQTTFVDAKAEIGLDTVILPFTIIEGATKIGCNCMIGPGSRIIKSTLADRVEVSNSIVVESSIGNNTVIGPYAYIRPQSEIGQDVKIGDFVEIKKSKIGQGSKVPHLSYIGDTFIGKGVNIGAGTITCNYDGKNKFPTTINDGAFIGSNSNLVAPVEIGEQAVTAAGSTITKSVPAGALGVSRSKQTNVDGWVKNKNGN